MAEISVLTPTSGAPHLKSVSAENGESLPAERFEVREILVIIEGCISLEREDCADSDLHIATETIEIPAGVRRSITAHETPTRFVLIYPD